MKTLAPIKFSLVIMLVGSLFLPCYGITNTLKSPLILEGKIGTYPIEMQILESNWDQGNFTGKYRYKNKTTYLTIKGEIYDSYLHIEEFYNEQSTGEFYLESADKGYIGKWISGSKWLEVTLTVKSGDESMLNSKSLEDLTPHTSTGISGAYGKESFWINDMWFQEDNPVLEIGFNGGFAVIDSLGGDSIRFKVEMVCGPTYHIAYAEGIAHKKGDSYEYNANFENDENCIITITFSERRVKLTANRSYECGFGARASLDDEMMKISDKVEFNDQQSLSDYKE